MVNNMDEEQIKMEKTDKPDIEANRITDIPKFIAEIRNKQHIPKEEQKCDGGCIFDASYDDYDKYVHYCIAGRYGLAKSNVFNPEECPNFVKDNGQTFCLTNTILFQLNREILLRESEIIKQFIAIANDDVVDFIYDLIYKTSDAKVIFKELQLYIKTKKFK